MPDYTKELAALKAATEAASTEALRLWERDGKEDRGSCGSACMSLKMSTKLGKAAVANGYTTGPDGYVAIKMPEGIQSQNADIWQGWMIAFRRSLIAAGYESAISKFWTYID
jgi:hypothetical protein